VLSDECYVEFTWTGGPRTILEHGLEGVLAVHSLSKRSNLAGARAGFYAGDPALVRYLAELRKHAGFMVPGPIQAAAIAAWGDDAHVDEQAKRYHDRLLRGRTILAALGTDAPVPAGGFYLWPGAPDGDAWSFARRLATEAGVLSSPGEFYGAAAAGHVRLAMVAPMERLDLVATRVGL
jgi:aspartate/methionine/tyrosine aminotransferase